MEGLGPFLRERTRFVDMADDLIRNGQVRAPQQSSIGREEKKIPANAIVCHPFGACAAARSARTTTGLVRVVSMTPHRVVRGSQA